MRIEILEHAPTGYEVRVVDAEGGIIRTFTYRTIDSARKAARAWTAAYDNCPIVDKSGLRE
jgi:hypothetical protein